MIAMRRIRASFGIGATFIFLTLAALPAAWAASITYQYNSKGQLETATYADGTVVTYIYDANGNRTGVTSTGGPDIKAPTVPLSIAATAVSSTRIDLTWSASTDGGGSGLVGYRVARCEGAGCNAFSDLPNAVTNSPHQDTGLIANTVYRYRVRAYDGNGNYSAYSTIVSATTLPDTIPPTPAGTLTATVQSSTRVDLSWGPASDSGGSGLAGYKIERCSGSACSDYAQIQQQAGTTYQDIDLAANTTYRYRVLAYDNAGNDSAFYTNEASAVTSQDTETPQPPAGLTATAISATRIDLGWSASTDSGGSGLAGYQIERCTGASCSDYAQVATSATNSFSDFDVVADTTYRYRVRAYDNAENQSTSYSNVASATTPQDTTRPSIPATLAATPVSSSRIDLSWAASTDAGENLDGYRIDRCQGAGCSTFTLLASVSVSDPGGRTYADHTVAPTTTYVYRVYAYDAVGNISDGYSPTASATTPADTTAPSVPSPSVTAASSTQLNVSWTSSADTGGAGLAGYKLERCQGLGCSGFSQIATLGSTTNTYSDSDRAANTTYVYRIRAYDSASPANHSAYSSSVGGTTLPDTTIPTNPSGLSASVISGSRIDLSWTGSTDSGGAGLAGYEIERCQGPNCSSFALVTTTTGTTYANSGLDDATTYRYRIRARDNATPSNRSGYTNIASASTPDTTPPATPSVSFEGISATAATAEWSAADNVAVTIYRYRINSGSWQNVGPLTSRPLTELTCYTQYTVQVQARDAAELWSSTGSGTFRTLDGCPPGAPGSATVSNITTTTATATWTAASDNVGVTAYQYRRTGSNWTQVGSSVYSASLSGMSAGTQYTFEVMARDAAGNWGPVRSKTFTTNIWPAKPTGLSKNQVADCAWSASWSAVPNATYYVFRNRAPYDNEWTVSGTNTTYSCPWGQAYDYRPRWVRACNTWGCSAESYY